MATSAQAPSDYILIETVLLPDMLSEEYSNGRFSVSVIRRAETESDRRLIAEAERLHPTPQFINAAVSEDLRTNSRWPSRGW